MIVIHNLKVFHVDPVLGRIRCRTATATRGITDEDRECPVSRMYLKELRTDASAPVIGYRRITNLAPPDLLRTCASGMARRAERDSEASGAG